MVINVPVFRRVSAACQLQCFSILIWGMHGVRSLHDLRNGWQKHSGAQPAGGNVDDE